MSLSPLTAPSGSCHRLLVKFLDHAWSISAPNAPLLVPPVGRQEAGWPACDREGQVMAPNLPYFDGESTLGGLERGPTPPSGWKLSPRLGWKWRGGKKTPNKPKLAAPPPPRFTLSPHRAEEGRAPLPQGHGRASRRVTLPSSPTAAGVKRAETGRGKGLSPGGWREATSLRRAGALQMAPPRRAGARPRVMAALRGEEGGGRPAPSPRAAGRRREGKGAASAAAGRARAESGGAAGPGAGRGGRGGAFPQPRPGAGAVVSLRRVRGLRGPGVASSVRATGRLPGRGGHGGSGSGAAHAAWARLALNDG